MDAWQQVTDDPISLQAIAGVKIPLKGTPPLRCATKEELDERRLNPVIDKKGIWQKIHSNSKKVSSVPYFLGSQ